MSPKSAKAAQDAGLGALEQRIGHRFADQGILEIALTHISATQGEKARVRSYQRLEFLGDRVLGLAIADLLYLGNPAAMEGDLAWRLSELVRKETCAAVAVEWGVAECIRLGPSEAKSGGRKKEAILGDVCEALIGAVFLDAGFDAARAVVERGFGSRVITPESPRRDAKTRLQEWAQGQGLATPVYSEVSRSGPDHAPVFIVAANVEGLASAEGQGASKRHAEQAAAENFMKRSLAPGE